LKEKGRLVLEGDGESDEVLKKAKIDDARLLVVATGNDSNNILSVIKGRSLNPRIYIVARAKMRENYQKMTEYADLVVSPTVVGAALMALGETPNVSRFVHTILNIQEGQRLWELSIASASSAVGKTVRDLALKERFNISLVALRSGKEFVVNPDVDLQVKAGDVLIALGEHPQAKEARKFLGS